MRFVGIVLLFATLAIAKKCPRGFSSLQTTNGRICVNRPVRNQRVLLPMFGPSSSEDDIKCLAERKVFWPLTGECHELLTQGPCQDNQWLALRRRMKVRNKFMIEVACQDRPCPCLDEDPLMCEVLVPHNTTLRSQCHPSCQVSLAAAQNGICRPGEQLYNTPFGEGICDCRPGHMRLRDGQCQPINGFRNGPRIPNPCPEGHQLEFDPIRDDLVCVRNICLDGYILLKDGRCHKPDTRANCKPGFKLKLDPITKQPSCQLVGKQKRVFDLMPDPNWKKKEEKKTPPSDVHKQALKFWRWLYSFA